MKLKDLFEQFKVKLAKKGENTKYFNLGFFQHFMEYQRLKLLAIQEGTYDDMYTYLQENIFTSDFYNKNSCCYCLLLELAYRNENLIKCTLNLGY